MRIGMVFESGPQGADKQVCEYLAQKIRPGVTICSVTHRNKAEMIADCGKDVLQLQKTRCERILIIWDLFPPWRKSGERPCRKEDREAILKSLRLAGVSNATLFMICIREELDAWLLADGRAITTVLSTVAHPARRIADSRNPDHVTNPKGRLRRLFSENRRGAYNDLVHAIKIIKEADLAKLRRSCSFCRFEEKLTARP